MITRRSFLTLIPATALFGVAPALAGPTTPAAPKPSAPPAGGPPTAEQVATRVQAYYDQAKTFKAGFKQQYVAKAYAKTREGVGSVIFQKPGKMSWRYTNNGNRIVSDGKLIRVYEKDNKQMFEQPLAKSPYPAALAFLVGSGSLKQSFKFKLGDAKQYNFEGGYVLLGQPLDPTPAYDHILLYVDAGTFQVRRVLLLDAQGNRNRFDFTGPEVNLPPPPGEFVFTPPKGTQVIRP